MEFQFDVNAVLKSDVVVVSTPNNNLLPKCVVCDVDQSTGKKIYSLKDVKQRESVQERQKFQSKLTAIVDGVGEKSASAQGLYAPITSAAKLTASDHRLYIMKDGDACNGRGAVLGILKVGVKKLFMSTSGGIQNEVNPLCLLDFYIDESKQRQGYGFRLFDIMLHIEKTSPEQIAMDQPSTHLLCFLKKYYGLDQPHFQANKFVVFPEFFKSSTTDSLAQERTVSPGRSSIHRAAAPGSRDAVPQPVHFRGRAYTPSFTSGVKSCLQWSCGSTDVQTCKRQNQTEVAPEVENMKTSRKIANSDASKNRVSATATKDEENASVAVVTGDSGLAEKTGNLSVTGDRKKQMSPAYEGLKGKSVKNVPCRKSLVDVKKSVEEEGKSYKSSSSLADRQNVNRKQLKSSELPPARSCTEKKWRDLYDSWKVMGVAPQDYSYLQKAIHPPLK